MRSITKLDTYDYIILPGVIRIKIKSNTDPILVDVLSEIENSNGKIYVDGNYYQYLEMYYIYTSEKESYLELEVVNVLTV